MQGIYVLISIRQASAGDLAAICSLADDINRQHWQHHPQVFLDVAAEGAADPDQLSRHSDFWLQAIGEREGTMLVAVAGQTVVGFVMARILPQPEIPFLAPRRVCRIGTIVVDTSMQGQGIGQRLMAAAEDWARRHDVVEMRLEVFDFNHDAMRFYDAAGFAVQSHILIRPLD